MEEPSRPRLGFIGVGAMGKPMAARLLEAGYSLMVHDVDRAAMASLTERGAIAANSPAAIAASAEIVLVCLPTPNIVRDVALGTNGLLAGVMPGGMTCYLDLSTTGPRMAAEVATRLAEIGVTALDAPVTGGVAGAAAGTLTIIGAGPAEMFERARPILQVLGLVHHVGTDAGMGQLLKLINNLLSTVALTATTEALALGVKAGLDVDAMLGVINAGSGRNSATEEKFPRSILPRKFSGGLALGLAYKDVRLCLDEAEAYGVPMRMGSSAKETMFLAKTVLGPDVDATNLVRLMESWTGIELKSRSADTMAAPP